MFANEFLNKLKTIQKSNKLKQEMNNLLSTFLENKVNISD